MLLQIGHPIMQIRKTGHGCLELALLRNELIYQRTDFLRCGCAFFPG